MKVTKMEAELYCVNCKANTIHEVTYVGENIEKIACMACETYLEIDHQTMMKNFKSEILERIMSKPSRMTGEIRHDLSNFLKSFPVRVITKPARIVKEIKEIEHHAHEEK